MKKILLFLLKIIGITITSDKWGQLGGFGLWIYRWRKAWVFPNPLLRIKFPSITFTLFADREYEKTRDKGITREMYKKMCKERKSKI